VFTVIPNRVPTSAYVSSAVRNRKTIRSLTVSCSGRGVCRGMTDPSTLAAEQRRWNRMFVLRERSPPRIVPLVDGCSPTDWARA
jgi:hypothetical protein